MIDIINLSLQMGNDNGIPSPQIVESIAQAVRAGIIVVAAAGNSGPTEGTMSRIATLPGVISVGSSDWEGTRLSTFSSRGWSNDPRSGPTIVAPGENHISLWPPSAAKTGEQEALDKELITLATLQRATGQDYSGGDIDFIRREFTVMTGTSQACAYVSGLLMKFIDLRRHMKLPHASEHAIGFLQRAANKMTGYGDHEQGYGFVSDVTIQEYLSRVGPDDPFWLSS